MPLAPGTRLGPYEIVAAIGAGGMGEVYSGRDTRLDRPVAIKVLPADLAADPHFRARFDREARAISQLAHPHICTLYDVGEGNGIAFLVMELLQGQTLADRLKNGSLALDEALAIAVDVADALSAAHKQQVVHRDLKPGNVMLTKSGAKLLDFGLAKSATPAIGLTTSPNGSTASTHLTGTGTILGTLHYMAPEQVEGRDVDVRADIWALGAVIYEMVTGRMAFDGSTPASVIGAIMQTDPPPLSQTQTLAPKALDRVVRRALAKDPDARWQTASDLAFALQSVNDSATPIVERITPLRRMRTLGWIAGIGLTIVAAAIAAVKRPPVTPERDPLWFEVRPVEGNTIPAGRPVPRIAVSPDGKKVAYSAAHSDGTQHLWVQRFSSRVADVIPSTDGAGSPFWAPDSRWIGYLSSGKLMKVDTVAGAVQLICEAPNFAGGTWNADGTIVFSSGQPRRLRRVLATGGSPTILAASAAETGVLVDHHRPQFLPDGRHLLFYRTGKNAAILLTDLDATVPLKIRDSQAAAVYSSGYVLFAEGNTLLAQPFDSERLQLTGEPVAVATGVDATEAAYAVSTSGVLAFRPPTRTELTQLTWTDRQGQQQGVVGERKGYQTLSLGPDANRIATEITDPRTGETDLWVIDAQRAVTTALTVTHGPEEMPTWSADGQRVVFASHRISPNGSDIGILIADIKSGTIHTVTENGGHVLDWSPDGRYVLYLRSESVQGETLVAFPVVPGHKPIDIAKGTIFHAQFSPDGRSVAYSSDRSGRKEIYVTAFPSTEGRSQISNNGGEQPRWVRRTNELIYLAPDGRLMAVPMKGDSTGSGFQAGTPTPLFEVHVNPLVRNRTQYAVSDDGQRFLVNALTGDLGTQSPTTVVLNWTSLLKK